MDEAYMDFSRLHKLGQSETCFVVRAKGNLKFRVVISRKGRAASTTPTGSGV